MAVAYQTLTMTAEKWMVLLATCLVCVSSNGEQFDNECKTLKVGALLGSSTLLPCRFSTSTNNTVTWTHDEKVDVVHLLSKGRMKFMDHRYGRVKLFPNQASKGNFSIRIDDLTESDLGSYRCQQNDSCHQVELFIGKSSQGEHMKLLIYVCVGVGLLILLCAGAYCCYKYCFGSCCNITDGDRNKTVITIANTVVVDNNFVYENDDQYPTNADHSRNHSYPPEAPQDPAGPQPSHSSTGIYPNLTEFNVNRNREDSQRKRQRFHIDLFTRLREASVRRHYYVNQAELSQQQAAAMPAETRHKAGHVNKKGKKKYEYPNPIYNRSTDRLDQM